MPCAHGSPGAALGQRVCRSRRRRSSSDGLLNVDREGLDAHDGHSYVRCSNPVLGPDLQVLFVGINPSLRSAEVGHHFARPGNRFYPALHAAGFTPRQLRPTRTATLPALRRRHHQHRRARRPAPPTS